MAFFVAPHICGSKFKPSLPHYLPIKKKDFRFYDPNFNNHAYILYWWFHPTLLKFAHQEKRKEKKTCSRRVLWNLTNIWACLFLFAVAADGNEPVQIKLYRSLKLWTFHVDLEESLGTLESTRIVYERILDLRIATPQIILNYAFLLEVWAFHQ